MTLGDEVGPGLFVLKRRVRSIFETGKVYRIRDGGHVRVEVSRTTGKQYTLLAVGDEWRYHRGGLREIVGQPVG